MPIPPVRHTMSDAERQMRDRILKRWMEKHAVYSDTMLKGITSGENVRFTYWGHRTGQDRWLYTTERMFDGKFWSMRYRYVASRRRYELVKSSVRRHAQRKDAKA